jgi:hypothetical protein
MCALTESTSTMFCIWPDGGSIFNIDYQYMLCLLAEKFTILCLYFDFHPITLITVTVTEVP